MKERRYKDFSDKRIKTEMPGVMSGKTFSILGDSISTFAGISNDASANKTIANNEIFYKGNMLVRDANHTWWGIVKEKTGMELLVNNSWSGSCVSTNGQNLHSAGCGTRAENLHNNAGQSPDVIFIYLGTNDYANSVELNNFEQDYEIMVDKAKTQYPQSEIYCFTLLPSDRDFQNQDDIKVSCYNQKIREISQRQQTGLVDLEEDLSLNDHSHRAVLTTRRGLHPSEGGMEQIALSVINVLASEHLQNTSIHDTVLDQGQLL